MSVKNIYEVFDEFTAAPDKEAKKQVLVRNDTPALRLVLRAAFHDNIKFVFDKTSRQRHVPNYIVGVGNTFTITST